MYFDLIIVGGGMVGAGLAAALQDANLSIALIDERIPTLDDPRLFALNKTTCQFLDNIGIWQRISQEAAPIHQVHVSKKGQFGVVKLNASDAELKELGFVLPAYAIEKALNVRLDSLKHIKKFQPAKLKKLSQVDEKVSLSLEINGEVNMISAPLVIGADGTHSTVRKEIQIQTQIFNYQQSAIVFKTKLKRPHKNIAYERFVKEGAIAMLPLHLQDNLSCASIWTVENDTANQLMNLSETLFLERLQKEFGYRLGRLLSISPRHCYPLQQVAAVTNTQGNVFLLGNAAHTLHPIAAQGFNLAIFEIAMIVEKIKAELFKSQPLSIQTLMRANNELKKQQKMSMGISHRLQRLYQDQHIFISLLRSVAMLGLDLTQPMKKKFINLLTGKATRVPTLLLYNE